MKYIPKHAQVKKRNFFVANFSRIVTTFLIAAGLAIGFPQPHTQAIDFESKSAVVRPTTKPEVVYTPAVKETNTISLTSPTYGAPKFKAEAKPTPIRTKTPSSTSRPRSNFSQLERRFASSGSILDIAASLAGIYYVYGGTTTAGFDCSGFTQYVYAKVGIHIPRVAEDQRRAARPVSKPALGDLVFFGIPSGHVGIYAGNGMMWDSPRTGKAIALREIYTGSGYVTYGTYR